MAVRCSPHPKQRLRALRAGGTRQAARPRQPDGFPVTADIARSNIARDARHAFTQQTAPRASA